MKEPPLLTVMRSQGTSVPAEDLWALLSGPQAWSVRPDRFAFDVTVPPSTRVRVVVGVDGARPVVSTYEVQDETPGRAISLRAGGPDRSQVVSFSAVPEGNTTEATIAVRNHGKFTAGRSYWKPILTSWLTTLCAVAEGRAPSPAPGMPESLRVRCMPDRPMRMPATASASVLLSAPPAAVWDAVYAPESSVTTTAEIVAAGVVPGTPAGRVGEMQYFVMKNPGGWFTTRVVAVTELDPGRSALAAALTSLRTEAYHLITPYRQGARLELAFRWPGNLIPLTKRKAYSTAMAESVHKTLNGYRELLEGQNPQPANH